MEEVEEADRLFMLIANKEEKKTLVGAPGKRTLAITKCKVVTLRICYYKTIADFRNADSRIPATRASDELNIRGVSRRLVELRLHQTR